MKRTLGRNTPCEREDEGGGAQNVHVLAVYASVYVCVGSLKYGRSHMEAITSGAGEGADYSVTDECWGLPWQTAESCWWSISLHFAPLLSSSKHNATSFLFWVLWDILTVSGLIYKMVQILLLFISYVCLSVYLMTCLYASTGWNSISRTLYFINMVLNSCWNWIYKFINVHWPGNHWFKLSFLDHPVN